MKIHTSLMPEQLYTVLRNAGAPINFESRETLGSRTHAYGYNILLTGSGGRSNTGNFGAGNYFGATWDEWGAFFGALYDLDPNARCGGTVVNPAYRNASHFHYLTADRFQKDPKRGNVHLPADTHPRHQWKVDEESDHRPYVAWSYHCSKCSAKRPPFIPGRDWS